MLLSMAFLSGASVKKSSWKRLTCSRASTGRLTDASWASASISDLPLSSTYIFCLCCSAKLYDLHTAYPAMPVQSKPNTMAYNLICLKLFSIFLSVLNSIFLNVGLFYLLSSLPPIFPAAEPAPAPAIFPAFIAVWLTFRVKFPAPPAWIIQPVTVGIVK